MRKDGRNVFEKSETSYLEYSMRLVNLNERQEKAHMKRDGRKPRRRKGGSKHI